MLNFWAKSGSADIAFAMHGVPHHGLDVAACAAVLMAMFPPPVAVPRETVVALVALHDIGKFSRPFQGKVEALWPAALGLYQRPIPGWPHDDVGFALLNGPLAGAIEPLFAGWRRPSARAPLLRAVAGHHGRPPRVDHREIPDPVACVVCREAAACFVQTVLSLTAAAPMPRLDDAQCAALAWWLAGLTTLADWLGSGVRWFPPAGAHADLAAYWRATKVRAERAVEDSGLVVSPVAPTVGLASLFPAITRPRPLQDWAGSAALPDGPALFVLEDATGAGKTEAALVLAHRLLAAGRGQGLFFALPTMATANAMYDRLADAYGRLFAPGPRPPSLVLAHGRRTFNDRFTDSILDDAATTGVDGDGDPADQPAGAQCAAWIADDRRKAFLAEIGVGTIDQALMAVLPTRHAMLRLLGLTRRVLIIDEAHAYDDYMTVELQRLLHFHAALGGSAILLSATLTARQRTALGAAFSDGLGTRARPDESGAYPLATIVAASGTHAQPIAPAIMREVAVERVATPEDAADALAKAAGSGGAVAWVRNTVDDAITAAALLRGRGLDPIVFHARFAMGDRLAVERRVLALFGKDADPADRAGLVLVATQVVEQSLDLDFDLMVSDLAPADLVIQRAGRVWRHGGRTRPAGMEGPRVLLLSPEPVAAPTPDWLGAALRGTGAVYRDTAMLWRGARALLGAGVIATPGNVRALVEAAFDRDAEGGEPAAFEGPTRKAWGAEIRDRGIARQNVLRFEEAYCREAGLWDPDIRTPTRLDDPRITLRLGIIEGGALLPICAHPDPSRAWALSEVSVRAARVAGLAPDPAMAPLVDVARREWGRWEQDVPVLVLRLDEGGPWRGQVLGPGDRLVPVWYTRGEGLIIDPADPAG